MNVVIQSDNFSEELILDEFLPCYKLWKTQKYLSLVIRF